MDSVSPSLSAPPALTPLSLSLSLSLKKLIDVKNIKTNKQTKIRRVAEALAFEAHSPGSESSAPCTHQPLHRRRVSLGAQGGAREDLSSKHGPEAICTRTPCHNETWATLAVQGLLCPGARSCARSLSLSLPPSLSHRRSHILALGKHRALPAFQEQGQVLGQDPLRLLHREGGS